MRASSTARSRVAARASPVRARRARAVAAAAAGSSRAGGAARAAGWRPPGGRSPPAGRRPAARTPPAGSGAPPAGTRPMASRGAPLLLEDAALPVFGAPLRVPGGRARDQLAVARQPAPGAVPGARRGRPGRRAATGHRRPCRRRGSARARCGPARRPACVGRPAPRRPRRRAGGRRRPAGDRRGRPPGGRTRRGRPSLSAGEGQTAAPLVERPGPEVAVARPLAGRLGGARTAGAARGAVALLPHRLGQVIARPALARRRPARRRSSGSGEGRLGGLVLVAIEQHHAAGDPVLRALAGRRALRRRQAGGQRWSAGPRRAGSSSRRATRPRSSAAARPPRTGGPALRWPPRWRTPPRRCAGRRGTLGVALAFPLDLAPAPARGERVDADEDALGFGDRARRRRGPPSRGRRAASPRRRWQVAAW